MRDNFPPDIVEKLAKRVGMLCSNGDCRKPTCGPQDTPTGAINVGVASHITAASPGGPRYNPELTNEMRRGIENGIWLCQTCSKLIDSDQTRFTVSELQRWKREAEDRAKRGLVAPTDEQMTATLLRMRKCKVPSYTHKVVYTIVDVVPGSHVSLTSPTRKSSSVLRWKDIKRAYEWQGQTGELTPSVVDEILRDSKNLESATMCALVLAMRDPARLNCSCTRCVLFANNWCQIV